MNWSKVQARVAARGDIDCPVCLGPIIGCASLGHGGCSSSSANDDKNCGQSHCAVFRTERLALLSCSHVFHERCLAAFEAFALSPTARTCPVCRSQYSKMALEPAPNATNLTVENAHDAIARHRCCSTAGTASKGDVVQIRQKQPPSRRGIGLTAGSTANRRTQGARPRPPPRRNIPGVAFSR